jgi:hypothetical protein
MLHFWMSGPKWQDLNTTTSLTFSIFVVLIERGPLIQK